MNKQNLYPRFPTAVARLLQYSGLRSNSGMGFLHTELQKMVNLTLDFKVL